MHICPLKLKLSYRELAHLHDYLARAYLKSQHPQAREELIVLAEHLPALERKLLVAARRNRLKPYLYSLPLSVGRILHRRWQQEPITEELQRILNALDYTLTQRTLKPDPIRLLLE